MPDRIGCINGVMVALQFKRNETEAQKTKGRIILQRYILNEISEAGGYSAIVYPENWFLVYNELIAFCGIKD